MDRTDPAAWAKRVERWSESGLSAREFSTELGISGRALRWWKWRLASDAKATTGAPQAKRPHSRRPEAPSAGTTINFVEVASPLTAAVTPIEIVLRSGVQLRVTTGFDAPTLERVLAIVEHRA